MIKLKLVLAFIVLFSSSYGQEHKDNPEIINDLNLLIPLGKDTVEILGDEIPSPRQIELLTKFRNGISKNYEWFVETMKKFPKGGAPYHENFGVTKEEYLEIQKFQGRNGLVTKSVSSLEVSKNNETIYFTSNDASLSILNSLTINLKINEVSLGNYKLPYLNAPVISDDRNAFQSKWKGYNWSFESPNDMNVFNNRSTLTAISYQVTIGRLEKNNRTFIILKGIEFNNGQQISNFEYILLFKD